MTQGQSLPAFISLREDPNNQRVYDEFATKLGAAGKRGADALAQSMSGVRDTIAQALSIPRNSGGSLDLQINQLREMEAQAEAVARATLQYANAQKAAAISSGQTSRARNEEIRAGFELARVEQQNVAQLRAKIAVLDQVQAELNQTAAATDKVITSVNRGTDAYGIHNASMRGSRVAMIQTGQQLQDMAIQFQMGTRASTIMAQQVPQLLFALTSLEGSANKTANKIGAFATLLSGPWSLAVVAAAAGAGMLIDKLLGTGDAANKGGSAMDKLANKLDMSKNSYDGLIAVVKEYNQAQSTSISLTYEAIFAAEKLIEKNLELAKAKLAGLEVEYASQSGNSKGGLEIKSGLASQITGVRAIITKLETDLGDSRVARGTDLARRASDSDYAITTAFNAERERFKQRAKADRLSANQIATGLRVIDDRQKAFEAQWKKDHPDSTKRTPRTPAEPYGGKELDQFGLPVRGGYTSSKYGVQRGKRQHKGIDYAVPVGTPVYATQDGVVTYAQNDGGNYGNLVKLNHGGGTESRYAHLSKFSVEDGARVAAGQVIGYSGGAKGAPGAGNSTGAHLHYEIRVNGKPVDPTKGLFPTDSSAVGEAAQRAAEAAEQKAKQHAEQMDRLADSSAERVARINETFDEQPRLIDRANQAMRELDRTAAELNETLATDKELTEDQRKSMEATVKDVAAAKANVQDALVRPYNEIFEGSEKRIMIERLITAGQQDQANALQIIWQHERNIGPLKAEQKQAILDQVAAEREVTEELQRRQAIIGQYLDATRSIKDELVSIFSGEGSFANFGKIFQRLNSQMMVEKLFGGAFRDLDNWIKGQSGIAPAVDYFSAQTTAAGTAAEQAAAAFNRATQTLLNPEKAGGPIGKGGMFGALGGAAALAANDNFGAFAAGLGELTNTNADLVSVGKRQVKATTELDPNKWARETSSTIAATTLASFGIRSPALQGLLGGAFYGNMVAGTPGAVLGGIEGIFGKDSKIGGIAGKGLGGLQTAGLVTNIANGFGLNLSNTGAQVGGALGSFLPIPGGSAIGSVVGGLIGKLFGSRPRGSGTVSNSGVTSGANNGDIKSALDATGGGLQDAIGQIASALGANVGNYSVGIGRYKDYFQVSSNPNDKSLGGSNFAKNSASDVYDGLDAEAAMRAAIGAALAQGAIKGISDASQKILASGKDLSAAIQKAVLIESIPKRLKALTDPVGAAIDELNREFETMVAALKEGGATAAQFADAQKLYELERARTVKAAIEQATGSLKSLYDSLTVGNDALSLRDRREAAMAAYNPLAARVAAGDTSAYGEFADAARTMLEIERQISGSQAPYFDLLRQVTELTKQQLDSQQVLINAASGGNNPFTGTAGGTGPANDNAAPVVAAIGDSNLLLTNINNNLITLSQQLVSAIGNNGGVITTQNLPSQLMNY